MYTGSHDAARHLNYLRQSLSQDTEAIGFFLSAGCPLSVKVPEGEWPLIPDVENLTKAINGNLKSNKKYSLLLEELSVSEKDINNVEEILTFLRSLIVVSKGSNVRGFTESDLLELERLVCKEIVQRLDVALPNQDTPYHGLCHWIGSIDRKSPVEIFTTNYDLLAEQALEDLEIPYFDGFVGAKRSFFDLAAVEGDLLPVHWSRLWKIHGSINWHQDTKERERKVHRSSVVKSDASHLIYPSHLKYQESRKMPYLALVDQLSRFLRKKSSFLIMSGYSFSDEHINDTIMNALKANPTAMVLALMYGTYSNNEEERYPEAYRLAKRQHNLNVWAFDKAIIGTNLGEWVKTDNSDYDPGIFKFITRIEVGGSEKLKDAIELGDFANFSDFLKGMIGSGRESGNV